MEEVHTVVNLVREYYAMKDFCVITPYDAQRKVIQDNLKRTNLPWEHVYNVDSFQGHEADYVIISVVRTDAAGFLKSTQRMNVMLTRCKRGMIVVTSQQFLRTAGVNILLGKLAQHWVSQIGTVATWTDSRLIINREADMPGVPGKPAFASPPNSLGRVASIASSPCLTAAQLYSRTPPAAVVAQDRPESPSRTVDDDFPRLPTPRAVIGGSGRTVSRNLVNAQITPSMARLTVQKSMAEPPQVCVSPVIRGPTAFPALSGAGGRQLQGRWRSQSDSVKSWRARA
ncbi:hypothetical protein OBBRIDRAFT_551636 [Obba rivulosa]|uniref:DNA2/NAM7 helicase-like C-terminal domain-containing protein n=1 Tax=Obba rivulosa TaxID=1052685 RepID=A0A8E2AZG4_9APHY|nr:hypothetical protein OBBRIDRAFT_551636 [Obba rivulosa]